MQAEAKFRGMRGVEEVLLTAVILLRMLFYKKYLIVLVLLISTITFMFKGVLLVRLSMKVSLRIRKVEVEPM